jgi:hypothetical protein
MGGRAVPGDRKRIFLAVQSTDVLKHWPADRWQRIVRWLVESKQCEADIPVAAVEAAVGCLLGAGAASDPQVFDLTDGSFRYEVFASPPAAASPPGMPAAAAVPAT